MPEPEKKENFWTTLPGILTGIAALLTAFTGFWVATGPHGNAPRAESVAVTDSTEPSSKPAQPPSSGAAVEYSAAPASTAVSAAITSVTVTSRVGVVTKLSAASFLHNSGDKTIPLMSGQTISFERIRSIDFLEAHYDQHMVDVRVTLDDGRIVTGDLQKDYAFTGDSDLGPFTIFVTEVRQIVFNR